MKNQRAVAFEQQPDHNVTFVFTAVLTTAVIAIVIAIEIVVFNCDLQQWTSQKRTDQRSGVGG